MLVHGLGGSPRWWRAVRLPGRDVRTAVYRGAEPLTLDEPSVVVGHSLGGLLAAQLAADRPELVRGLVLVAPVGAPRHPAGYATGLLGTLLGASPALLRTIATDAARWGLPALARGAWAATRTVFAGRITAPTMLVWGERDRIVPPARAESWRSAIPAARLELIPGAGHVPMLETPHRFNELLHDFLDDLRV